MKGIFVKLEQGSQEWLQWRKNKIGASDAPVIMGVSPWATPYELFLQKVNDEQRSSTAAMRRGNELEEDARRCFELETGIIVQPCVVQHPEHEWMIASLDGLDFDGTTLVEIKCPNRIDHETALDNMIPDKYFPQIQHQMAVTGLPYAYYYSYDGKKGALVKVEREDEYIEELIKSELEFYGCLNSLTPPALCERDVVEITNDAQFSQLAYEYKTTIHQLKELEEKEKKLKQSLIDRTNDKNIIGSGLRLTKSFRRGNIDYSEIPELQNKNLEAFRRPPVQYWKVSLV